MREYTQDFDRAGTVPASAKGVAYSTEKGDGSRFARRPDHDGNARMGARND